MFFFRFSSCSIGVALILASVVGRPIASAAIPPMSDEELQSIAETIVIGKVTRIRTRVTSEDGFEDEEFYFDIKVSEVEKGRVGVGEVITGKTWRPKKRPSGFTGPQGQNEIPQKGQRVRVYCRGTVNFQFRRSGQGPESACLILEPNGLSSRGLAPDKPLVPKEFRGEWESSRKRDHSTIVTTGLTLSRSGLYHETNRVEEQVGDTHQAKSSISQGQVVISKGRVTLDGTRTLMVLRDGRLLVEGEFGANVFQRKSGIPIDDAEHPELNPFDKKPKPGWFALTTEEQEFADLAGMTFDKLSNGDLKVTSVDPTGGAARKGIRRGHVIFKWSVNRFGGRGAGWSASFR